MITMARLQISATVRGKWKDGEKFNEELRENTKVLFNQSADDVEIQSIGVEAEEYEIDSTDYPAVDVQ